MHGRAALLLGLLASSAHAAPEQFTRQQQQALQRGETVTRFWTTADDAGAGWAARVVSASPEQVFKVIADVERYKDFTNRMTVSHITRRDSTSYDFFYRIDMPWPLSDHWCVTRNTHAMDPRRRRYRRRWTLLRGTFVRNDGFWLVRPWGKLQALLLYSVVLRPRGSVPDFVIHHVTRVALPRSVQTMRRRVLELRQAGKL